MEDIKLTTVDQLEELARRSDERFIDKEELAIAQQSGYYKLTSSDTVTDVYGDGYAYKITVNTDFSAYVEHIKKFGWLCFDLTDVLGAKSIINVSGFKVTGSGSSYTIVGDCTSLDVWYHITLTSTTWS